MSNGNTMNEPVTDGQMRFIKTIRALVSNAPVFTGTTKGDACEYIGKYKGQLPEKPKGQEPEKPKGQEPDDVDVQWIKDPERFMVFRCSNCGNIASKGERQIYCDMCGKRMRPWSTK